MRLVIVGNIVAMNLDSLVRARATTPGDCGVQQLILAKRRPTSWNSGLQPTSRVKLCAHQMRPVL